MAGLGRVNVKGLYFSTAEARKGDYTTLGFGHKHLPREYKIVRELFGVFIRDPRGDLRARIGSSNQGADRSNKNISNGAGISGFRFAN